MHWGKFIFALYGSFILLMGILIYKSVTQKFDLVTPDYYAQELKFQEKIDATKMTQSLSSAIICDVENQQFIIHLPTELQNKPIKGKVHFYCAWAAENDKTVNFQELSTEKVSIALPQLTKGKYKAIIDWEAENQQYHHEQQVFL